MARVRGESPPGHARVDHVILMRQPRLHRDDGMPQQPHQLRQSPGGLHLVAHLPPQRLAGCVRFVRLGLGASVVIHEASGQRTSERVDQSDGS